MAVSPVKTEFALPTRSMLEEIPACDGMTTLSGGGLAVTLCYYF